MNKGGGFCWFWFGLVVFKQVTGRKKNILKILLLMVHHKIECLIYFIYHLHPPPPPSLTPPINAIISLYYTRTNRWLVWRIWGFDSWFVVLAVWFLVFFLILVNTQDHYFINKFTMIKLPSSMTSILLLCSSWAPKDNIYKLQHEKNRSQWEHPERLWNFPSHHFQ